MENVTTHYFKRVVQMLVTEQEFELIKDELLLIPVAQRKAFWNLILAGFRTKNTLKNYKNLFELKKAHNLEYEDLISMILFVDTEHNTGIYSKGIKIFEQN